MAEVHPKVSYTVNLTSQEYTLVTKALSGIIHPDTRDAEEAVSLCRRLLESRRVFCEQMIKLAQGALDRHDEMFPADQVASGEEKG